MRAINLLAVVLWTLTLSLQSLYAQPGASDWPGDSDWKPLRDQSGNIYYDPDDNVNGQKDLVGDATNGSAYLYNDGTYQFFRLRLEGDPRKTDGDSSSGYDEFGWGVELDTDGVTNTYELLIMLDGNAETVEIRQNTDHSDLDDPSDSSEEDFKTYSRHCLGPA